MPAPTPHDERNGDPVLDAQENLVRALQHPLVYDHPVGRITVLETHISWVILTGEYAYKIKKAVNFGFLDFSTLEKRHFYCQEELRLNRRFAAGLYLDVVAITGSLEQPSLNGAGDALEYAVRMRQFPQEGLLSSIASHKALTPSCVDDMIELVARMHGSVGHAAEDTDFGVPADIHHWVVENFEYIRPALTDSLHKVQLDRLERWCQEEYQDRKSLFQTRKQAGFVRECHGDLHLGNLALINGRITPFDCIEFNPQLRWIDIMSEAAFLMMDVEDRGYSGLAYRFLNGYLQRTGDYDGVRLLRYYLVYRALVRAKVAVLRLGQADLEPAGETAAWKEFESYMQLARQYVENRRPAVIITHGVSGSGKSWWAAQLAERLGAIRIRSDVERKRLFGYKVGADTRSGIQTGIYSSPASERTYEQLAVLAQYVINAGYPAIIDATFLQRAERNRFRRLASEFEAPFVLLHFEATEDVLRTRIRERQASGIDPSEAGIEVLEVQLESQEGLQPDEGGDLVEITDSRECSLDALAGQISKMIAAP
jgi:hypothetical protein